VPGIGSFARGVQDGAVSERVDSRGSSRQDPGIICILPNRELRDPCALEDYEDMQARRRSVLPAGLAALAAILLSLSCKPSDGVGDKETSSAAPAPAGSGDTAAPAPIEPEKPHPGLLDPSLAKETAPESFKVRFETSRDNFVVEVTRSWAPNGADRFWNLVKIGYFDDCRFFRVLKGFMAQVGIHGDPKVSAVWSENRIPSDPVVQKNDRGFLSYAMGGGPDGPETRTTQFFINYRRNANLDGMGFASFGRVVEGMEVVDSLYGNYGEGAPQGNGPAQGRIQAEGNAYLDREFPKLDWIKRARIIE
jgi:peptidyl-prolyl cis-trans isomerase A (cyclophilin A)